MLVKRIILSCIASDFTEIQDVFIFVNHSNDLNICRSEYLQFHESDLETWQPNSSPKPPTVYKWERPKDKNSKGTKKMVRVDI